MWFKQILSLYQMVKLSDFHLQSWSNKLLLKQRCYFLFPIWNFLNSISNLNTMTHIRTAGGCPWNSNPQIYRNFQEEFYPPSFAPEFNGSLKLQLKWFRDQITIMVQKSRPNSGIETVWNDVGFKHNLQYIIGSTFSELINNCLYMMRPSIT